MFQKGEIFEGPVRGENRGGVLVDCWGTTGFIPNSMVSPSVRPEAGMSVRAVFVEVDELQNRLILSQRQILQAELLKALKPGDVVEGEVTWLEAYGAFVDIKLKGGRTCPGMIHKSELSWGAVIVPDTVVSVGDKVKCKVLEVEPNKGRVALSLRQMTPDPLKQNLETVLPLEAQVEWSENTSRIPELEIVMERLRADEGITDIKVGRQASVPGVVSQDLELWLARDQVGEYYNVVARAGSTVQELAVYSGLSKAELKAAIDRALQQVL